MYNKVSPRTPWGREVDPDRPLPEHPRPQLRRDAWANLNGRWDYAIRAAPERPEEYDGSIVVPFSPEAALSGVGRQLQPRRVAVLPPHLHRPRPRAAAPPLRRRGPAVHRLGQRRRGRQPHRRLPALHRRHHRGGRGGRERAGGPGPATCARPAARPRASSASTTAGSGTPPSPASGRPSGWSRCPKVRRVAEHRPCWSSARRGTSGCVEHRVSLRDHRHHERRQHRGPDHRGGASDSGVPRTPTCTSSR